MTIIRTVMIQALMTTMTIIRTVMVKGLNWTTKPVVLSVGIAVLANTSVW